MASSEFQPMLWKLTIWRGKTVIEAAAPGGLISDESSPFTICDDLFSTVSERVDAVSSLARIE